MDKKDNQIILVLAVLIGVIVALYLWSKKAKAEVPPIPPVTCPVGTVLDNTTGQCVPIPPVTCPAGTVWEPVTGTCELITPDPGVGFSYHIPIPTPWDAGRLNAYAVVRSGSFTGLGVAGIQCGAYFRGNLEVVGVTNQFGECLLNMPIGYLEPFRISCIIDGVEHHYDGVAPWLPIGVPPGGGAQWVFVK